MSETSEGPGQVLRAEREALGVTTRDVAETLNLDVSVVEAIEADDYERMPAAVFARGYIRAYARLLSLEPEPVVARYPEDVGVADGNGTRRTSPAELLRQNARLVAGAGALLLLLVILAVWLWPDAPPAAEFTSGSSAQPPAATEAVDEAEAASTAASTAPVGEGDQPVVAPAAPSSAPASRSPAAENGASVDGGEPATDEPATVAAPEPAAGPDPTADLQADVPAPAASATTNENASTQPDTAAAPRADPPGVRRITEFGSDRLSFEFSEDCWVEVKSATGRRLYSDLSVAGRTLSLVGQGPFRVLLGYAPGARMSFNGEPVSLTPHTRNNVATLVVGQ